MDLRLCLTVVAIWLSVAVPVSLGEPDVQALSNAQLVAQAPPADEWREVSPVATEIRRRILADVFSDDDWRTLLRQSKAIYARTDWPEGRPFAIGMAYPIWLTDLYGTVSAQARLPNAHKVVTEQTWMGCALANDAICEKRRYMVVGDVPPGTNEVVLAVEFRTDRSSKKPRWAGTLTLPIRLVPSTADGLTGVTDPRIDAALRESVVAEVAMDQGERPTDHLWLYIYPARTNATIEADIGLHMILRVVRNGQTVSEQRLGEVEWRMDSPACCAARVDVFNRLQLNDPTFLNTLSVHIAPDRDSAFRDLKRSKFWDGQVVVPMREAIERKTVQPRPTQPSTRDD